VTCSPLRYLCFKSENYKRGLFLANLSETEKRHEVALNGQLPDYLPALLLLVDRLPEDELRADLISQCMVPALGKMSEALAKNDNLYARLISVVEGLLKTETIPTGDSHPSSDRESESLLERISHA